ncbi:MAG: ribonuclease III [Phycisphaerae bacterium]|jgi:ribonuclease-3|nr:ribonuclease III [Phycisphaerae bacterium]
MDEQQEVINQCQELLDYQFSNIEILARALTHSSVAHSREDSNERMEFLGDAVLALVVCRELYDHRDELTEGEMTKVKSSVVSRSTCAIVAEEIGLCDQLFLGKGMSKRGQLPVSVAAAVFESIIGAIYLDGGLEPARDFILHHINSHMDEALANEHQQNFKSLLQQYAQRRLGLTPDYHLLDEKGPDHSKCFEVAVAIEGRHFPSAWGMTKKQAEQGAAQLALAELGLLEDDDLSQDEAE